jgi:hypothetical protein
MNMWGRQSIILVLVFGLFLLSLNSPSVTLPAALVMAYEDKEMLSNNVVVETEIDFSALNVLNLQAAVKRNKTEEIPQTKSNNSATADNTKIHPPSVHRRLPSFENGGIVIFLHGEYVCPA